MSLPKMVHPVSTKSFGKRTEQYGNDFIMCLRERPSSQESDLACQILYSL